MKNNKAKVIGALKRVKDKVIDKTSDALSSPSRFISDGKRRGHDNRYKTFKMVNDMKGKSDKGNESDPLFRARATMKLAQEDAMRKKSK